MRGGVAAKHLDWRGIRLCDRWRPDRPASVPTPHGFGTIEPDGEFEARHVSGTVRVKRFTPGLFVVGEYLLPPPPVFILTHGGDRRAYDGLLGPQWLGAREVQLDFTRRTMAWR